MGIRNCSLQNLPSYTLKVSLKPQQFKVVIHSEMKIQSLIAPKLRRGGYIFESSKHFWRHKQIYSPIWKQVKNLSKWGQLIKCLRQNSKKSSNLSWNCIICVFTQTDGYSSYPQGKFTKLNIKRPYIRFNLNMRGCWAPSESLWRDQWRWETMRNMQTFKWNLNIAAYRSLKMEMLEHHAFSCGN